MATLRKIGNRYYAYFYDRTRTPRRKSHPLGVQSARAAQALLKRREYEYAIGVFDPWTPRNAAVEMAEIGGDEAIDALIGAVRSHPNEYVRAEAASALGWIGDDRALEVLDTAAASDSSVNNVRPIAATAAEKIREGS